MIRSYVNTVIKGKTQQEVADYLAARGVEGYVSPQRDGFVVLFGRKSDPLEYEPFIDITRAISVDLECAALTTVNQEDKSLWYLLYDKGRFIAGYDSRSSAPVKSSRLCSTFGARGQSTAVWLVLKTPHRFLFSERNRHGALAKLLSLPRWSVGFDFELIEQGKLPPGLDPASIKRLS